MEPDAASRPAVPSEGWGVLHLHFSVRGPRTEAVDVESAAVLVEAFEAEPDYQCLPYAVVGQRADLGLMLVGPDLVRLHGLHRDLLATPLGSRLEERPELSFVSLTEASEYMEDDGSARVAASRDARLHPRNIRLRRMLCFYPMAKRRTGDDNWYRLPFDRRRELMYGHGKVGRAFSGRVQQMITAATGFSDWEWGVTLFVDDPKAIKDVVYEMRFDEVSARYGEFGPFVVGLLAPFREAVAQAGIRAT
ncbi:MAG: Coproheme decarboxylase HemQ (no EC) [uncultured Thermoleophilia bacterium]|uniref:Coproheme decarboxylase n=1 Tax=uncultured Thermoleophilia bacterium TaxID=1497501 RepID=A0A6J4UDI7_9ACTN|nr:MAG: Coproheme decarboxylase HemQ (no EC) [uncultured Thermoleophilia bacterium]